MTSLKIAILSVITFPIVQKKTDTLMTLQKTDVVKHDTMFDFEIKVSLIINSKREIEAKSFKLQTEIDLSNCTAKIT